MLNTDNRPTFEAICDLIRKQPYFSKFPDEDIRVLASLFKTRFIPKEQTIVTQGDFVNSIFLIVKGTAQVLRVSFDDGKVKSEEIALLSDNQAIGLNEAGLYSLSGKRTATVVALTDMTLLELSVASFHGFALSSTRIAEIMRDNVGKDSSGL